MRLINISDLHAIVKMQSLFQIYARTHDADYVVLMMSVACNSKCDYGAGEDNSEDCVCSVSFAPMMDAERLKL